MPLADLNDAPRSTTAPVPGLDECEQMFGHFLQNNQNDPKHKLNDDEQKKIRSSFKDPKFREMLADYMEEISDPKYRAETEQYISQMENDDQVPAGKELVRPEACFVVKTHIVPNAAKDDKGVKGDKLFVNIVQSAQIAPPVGTPVNGGMQWSLPLSVGPKRFEKDKEGGQLVPTFDACFHPEALKMVRENKSFRDYVVSTALENVQASLNGSTTNIKDFVRKEYHVLRGVPYKNGTPAIMMMATDKMAAAKKPSKAMAAAEAVKGGTSPSSSTTQNDINNKNKNKSKNKAQKSTTSGGVTAVKKGFLNSTSSSPVPSTNTPSLVTEINEIDKEEPKRKSSLYDKAPTRNQVTENASNSTSKSPSQLSTTANTAVEGLKLPMKEGTGSASSGGAIAPTYHMKERGSYRISDSMQSRVVQPSRPTELDVIIELPSLAAKPNMDLDVSTDKLKFTADRLSPSQSSTYELVLKLPYPCDGEKGKAKFDKVKKELRVTIPVIPPKFVKENEVIGTSSEASKSALVSEVSQNQRQPIISTSQRQDASSENQVTNTSPEDGNEDDEDRQQLSEKARKEQARAKAIAQQEAKSRQAGHVDHSKWLNPMESKRMTFDIPEGAKLVAPTPPPPSSTSETLVEPAKSSKIVKASSLPSSSSTLVSNVVRSKFEIPKGTLFEASKIFKGRVLGYVFKSDVKGIGYYLDTYYQQTSSSTSKDSSDRFLIASSGKGLIPAYDFKQMNEVLTVLVQVPHIKSQSVDVKFSDKRMTLSFAASKEEGGDKKEDISIDQRYTLILNTFGELAVKKCRFDVADKNMIVVLYKLKEEFWETPFLSVEPDAYDIAFPKSTTSSSSASEGGVVEDMQLQASLRSIEKAAAKKSLEATAQIPAVTLPSSSQQQSGQSSSSRIGGNDVVAPTSFQNTIMFELD